jgi:hypothetical protein
VTGRPSDYHASNHNAAGVRHEPKRWYRSTNFGATWEPCKVGERSPLAAIKLNPAGDVYDDVHDDGVGNLYRYEVDR